MQFDRVGHFTRIPVTLSGSPRLFLFDTGIGVNAVSPSLADQLNLAHVGEMFGGQRMSGQRVEAELVYLPPLTVDDQVLTDQVAAVVDLGPDDQEGGFSGVLGLSAFNDHTVTVDPDSSTLVLTVGEPGQAAFRVPLSIRRRGPSTESFAELALPDSRTISVEVDTGSGCLILDAGLLNRGEVTTLGDLEATEGVDETGYQWARLRGRLDGGIHFAAAPQSGQENPCVLFQDIIYDGLIGTEFLDRFRYTFDVGREQLLLTPRRGRGP